MSREATAELSPHLIADFHHPLPETGYLRLHQIIGRPARNGWPAIPALIPVSRSTWWAGVKSGRYPKPVHTLGPNIKIGRASCRERGGQYGVITGVADTV